MKKPASTATKLTPKKSPSSRTAAGHRTQSSPLSETTDDARLEVTAPTAIALLDEPVLPAAASRRRVRFGYFRPEAREVFLVGSFNGWDPRISPLQRDSLGDWSIEMDLPTGKHRYRFVVDGEWRDDPTAQQTAQNPYGGFDAIVVVV